MARARTKSENIGQLVKSNQKKYVRIEEGCELFSMGRNNFRILAEEAGAKRKLKRMVLYNIACIENYIELMGSTEE